MTPSEKLRRAILNDEFPNSDQFFERESMANTIPDRLSFERNAAVGAWMSNLSGRRVNPAGVDWQSQKDALAQGFFKMPEAKGITDEQVHSLVKSHIQTTDDAANLAADGALSGLPLSQVVAGFNLPGIATRPGVKGRLPSYVEDATRRYTRIAAKMAPYRPLVKELAGELSKEMTATIPTTDKFQSIADRLLSVPEQDRPLVIKAIGATGGKSAEERASYLGKIASSMGRMTETTGAGLAEAVMRYGLVQARESSKLTGDEATAQQFEGERARRQEFEILTQQIRQVADAEVDPIKAEGVWAQLGLDVARMIPQSAVSVASPSLGFGANLAYFRNTQTAEAMMDNPRLTRAQAEEIANFSAPISAAAETVSALIPFGRVPGLGKFLRATTTSVAGNLGRLGTRVAAGAAGEVAEEMIQATAPLAVQDALAWRDSLIGTLKQDMPSVDWERSMPDFAKIAQQTWAPALVYSLIGGGAASISEVQNGRSLAQDVDAMISSGIKPEVAEQIKEAATANDWRKADVLFKQDFDARGEQKATDEQRAEATQRLMDRIKVQEQAKPENWEDPEYVVSVRRNSQGWQVEQPDGTLIPATSLEAAQRIQADLKQTASVEEAEALVQVIDDWHFTKAAEQAETKLTGETVTGTSAGVFGLRDGKTRAFDAKALETIRQQAENIGIATDTQDVFAHVNGSNEVYPSRVAKDAKEIVKRLNLFQSQKGGQPQVITFLHEAIESSFQLGMAKGVFNEADTRKAFAALAPALDPKRAKTDEERRLYEHVKELAAGQGDSTMLRETVSELAVRDVLGRDRKNQRTGLRSGSISRAIEAAVMGAKTAQEANIYKRFRALLKAFSAYLRGVLSTVRQIKQAKDKGTIGEDWNAFVDKVLGLDEVTELEKQAIQEAQNITAAGNMAFSVSPITPEMDREYLAAVEAGDMETAQKMVDEAAKAAGYNSQKVYHGTQRKFDVFDINRAGERTDSGVAGKGFYFTAKKAEAKTYAKRRGETAGRVIAAYLKLGNQHKTGKFPDIELPSKTLEDLINGPTEYSKKLTEWMILNGYESVDFNGHIVVFNPNQIKSADPVTYDSAGKVIPLSQRFNEQSPDIRFSVSPIKSLDELSDAIQRQMSTKPAEKLRVWSQVQRNLQRLRDNWSKDRWTWKGDRIRHISEKRTKASLDAEQAFRQRSRQRELIDEGMMSLTSETLMAYDAGRQTLEDDPLIERMLGDHGKLMSKSTAESLGKDIADLYDDAVWIPPSWYAAGAGITPDVMANNLGFETVSEMWAALDSSIRTVRSANEAFKKATDAVKSIERNALEQSRKEAQEWRDEADAMQAEDWNPRASLIRDLVTLEAMIATLPKEIRGQVGGFVALARKGTEKARLAELQKRVEKMGVLLEKHLKEEYGDAVDKLFDKYRPEREAGKKAKGKLDPDAQEISDAAEAAMDFTPDQTSAELAKIDTLLGAESITPEEETKLETMRELVQLMGDWKNADSARRESAFLALRDTLEEGWAKWKLKQLQKREEREEQRKALRTSTKRKGIGIQRDQMGKESAKVLGKANRWLLNLSSFSDVVRFIFGGSKEADALVSRERDASNAYEDAIQSMSEQVDEFFTSLGNGVLRGEQMRFDMSQPSITVGTTEFNKRELSELQGIQALLIWQQEDGKRHMEGPRDENNQPIEGKWAYDQAWIDELTSKLSPEAMQVKQFLETLYGAEYQSLNALYRERHGVNLPRHDRYAPITVKPQQAKQGEMVDPVSGAAVSGSILTPGALRSRNRSAVAEPQFRDALATFIAHTKQMEHWKAYYDFAIDAQAVLGNREVMNAVEASVGTEGVSVLRKWVDVFAQGGTRDAAAGLEIYQGLSRLASRAAVVGLLGRFSTILVQSTQLAAASVKMPVGAYLKRLGLLLSGNLEWSDAMNSEFIQRRIKTAPPIVQQAMRALGDAKRPNQITRAVRFLGNLLSGADGLFTSGTYAILLDYHRTMGRKMGLEGAELEAHAHREAVTATEQVAQPVRAGTRSLAEITNTSPLAKMSWAYASEARQKMALFAWSAKQAKADPAGFVKTSFLVFVVGGLMSQVLKNLWREAKGDDDEKKWSAARLTQSMFSPITGAIPGLNMLMGEGGQLSGAKYAQYAVEDLFDGDADMKDIDTILSVMGYFNDTAAGIAALSHAGYDFAQVLDNAFGEE